MADQRRRILAEVENVRNTLNELETAIGRSERSTIELAAIATFVHNT